MLFMTLEILSYNGGLSQLKINYENATSYINRVQAETIT